MDIDWRLIFVLAVIVHGIGHLFPGFLHTSDIINLQKIFGSGAPSNDSWLLTEQLKINESTVKLFTLLFLLCSIGFFIVAGAFWWLSAGLSGCLGLLGSGVFVHDLGYLVRALLEAGYSPANGLGVVAFQCLTQR